MRDSVFDVVAVWGPVAVGVADPGELGVNVAVSDFVAVGVRLSVYSHHDAVLKVTLTVPLCMLSPMSRA